MRAIWAIASTTRDEAVRRRVLLVMLLIAVLFLAIAPGLNVLSARQETTVLKELTLGIIQISSAVIAIVLTVYMIPNEIERRTIYTILSKPVQRWQFLIGKYLGAVMALGLFMAVMTAVLLIMYATQQEGVNAEQLAGLVKAPVLYFIQMSLLAAVATFFSTFLSPIVNFFLTGGVFLVGQLFNPFFESMKSSETVSPIARGMASLFHLILPNFANYNVENVFINPHAQIRGSETTYMITITAYGVIYIAILLMAGILIFDRREV
jgi:ABC-type transport system involved in multi-copper enzyme maturation permease subunit